MRADPILKIHYFLQEGYVCTEEFTNTDAGVVCTENGFLYGKAVRASAVGKDSFWVLHVIDTFNLSLVTVHCKALCNF